MTSKSIPPNERPSDRLRRQAFMGRRVELSKAAWQRLELAAGVKGVSLDKIADDAVRVYLKDRGLW